VPFDPARGLDVAAVLRARPDWAVAHEMLPASYASLVAARTDPDPAVRFRALDYLGLVCALLGLYPESVQFDREAVALAPDALAPRRRLVYTLLRLGRWDEARAALEAIGRIAPEDALSQLAARQASAYARGKIAALQRPDLPSPPVDAALSQYPLVAEDERDRLLADFYHAKLD
jgi:tetratricopeptide (TPR) repeat protein